MAFASLLVCLGLLCSSVVVAQECSSPLGMENRDIPDAQITASSEYDASHQASNGRLNFQAGGGKHGAWSAGANDANQWLQVNLAEITKVTGIKTQGRQDTDQWVTSYTVSYSNDGTTFTSYYQNVVLQGNTNRDHVVSNEFSPPINARYIRVHPKTWHGYVSMRMELLGCPPGLDSATCNSLKSKGFCGSPAIQEVCPLICLQPCSNVLADSACNNVKDSGRCGHRNLFLLCRKSCFKCDEIYVPKGCWKDQNGDRIMGAVLHRDYSEPEIVNICRQKAAALGFSTFGVEATGECFSGANAEVTFRKHGQAPDGDCIDGKGGNFRMSVYQFI